ncbi:unnamed protein product, partial [Didymodactylos carnosus]
VVKDLKPTDEGVYTLKSEHLILDTPHIHVLPSSDKKRPSTTEKKDYFQRNKHTL